MNPMNPLDTLAKASEVITRDGKFTFLDVITIQLNIDEVEGLQKNRRPLSHRGVVPTGMLVLYIDTFSVPSKLIGYGFNGENVLCRPADIPKSLRFMADTWFVQFGVRLDAPSRAALEECRTWVLSVLKPIPAVSRPRMLRAPVTELDVALSKFTRPLAILVPSELLYPESEMDVFDCATIQEDYTVVSKYEDKTRYETLFDYLAFLRNKWGGDPKSLTVAEALSAVLVNSTGPDGCYDEEKSLAVASESAGLNDLQYLQKVALFGHLPPTSLTLYCGSVPVLLAENHLFTVGDKTNLTALQALNAVWGTDHDTARWALYYFVTESGQSLGALLYGLA